MRLEWFEVQGYKNTHAPLRLNQLGVINVVHGDNNVGKSNLLESVTFVQEKDHGHFRMLTDEQFLGLIELGA